MVHENTKEEREIMRKTSIYPLEKGKKQTIIMLGAIYMKFSSR